MNLQFLGAARQVSGSMYLLEVDDYRILIDCGLDLERKIEFQPNPVEFRDRYFGFEASMINLVVLTHAHIDHSGSIPILYREGFEGQILCTPPTADLVGILLYDSANLNLKKVKAAQGNSNRKKKKMDFLLQKGDLYFPREVDDTLENFVTLNFNRKFRITDTISLTFYPAGHLLGAAHVFFEITEEGQKKTLAFSGDIGRINYPLHVDPVKLPEADFLIMESTYGNRIHQDTESHSDALYKIIKSTCVDKPGRLIIPAFSVGRTQAVLFTLNQLIEEGKIPPIKVFTDSPLGKSSTKIYQKYISYLNQDAKDFYNEVDSLFDFENLVFMATEKDSHSIDNFREPCIIISSSGMISGGRVEHHIAQNLENSYATILLIGYAADGTIGRDLLEQKDTIIIKNKEYKLNAKIEKIDVFSGHADKNGLIDFVNHQNKEKLKKIFLTHGDNNSMLDFQRELEDLGYKEVICPEKNEIFDL